MTTRFFSDEGDILRARAAGRDAPLDKYYVTHGWVPHGLRVGDIEFPSVLDAETAARKIRAMGVSATAAAKAVQG
jgi:hypothetical protein